MGDLSGPKLIFVEKIAGVPSWDRRLADTDLSLSAASTGDAPIGDARDSKLNPSAARISIYAIKRPGQSGDRFY
jgi:hypothetical protein